MHVVEAQLRLAIAQRGSARAAVMTGCHDINDIIDCDIMAAYGSIAAELIRVGGGDGMPGTMTPGVQSSGWVLALCIVESKPVSGDFE